MRAAMPANTTVVAPLVDERMRIEVEVTARKAPGDQA
jgi:enamine deaminase RidA (YjgF/YER057c/UK114 family)